MKNIWMVYTTDDTGEIGQVVAVGNYKNEALTLAENYYLSLAKKEWDEEKQDLYYWVAEELQKINGTEKNSVSIDYDAAIRVNEFAYRENN